MAKVKRLNATYTKQVCQSFAACTGWDSGPCQRLSAHSADCKSFNYYQQGVTCEWITTWTYAHGRYSGRKGPASCA